MRTLLVVVLLTLAACPKRSMEDVLPAYAKAYDTAFDRLKGLELSDAQTRVERLGEAGKRFELELSSFRRRQGEVSDLLVKAVEAKKQALADKNAQAVDDATKVLLDADARAQSLVDLKRLHESLTAAGAPRLEAGPPRDPNARD